MLPLGCLPLLRGEGITLLADAREYRNYKKKALVKSSTVMVRKA